MKTPAMAGPLAPVLALVLAGAGMASAQPAPPPPPPRGPPPPPARGPALDVALDAAQTAVSICKSHGYNVTAVVVDSAGVPKAMLVGDGAPGMTTQVGVRKAVTAVTFKEPSGAVGEKAKTDKALADKIASDPRLITWAGGLPLKVGDEVVGAIGVSGAPGGDKDEACATPAVEHIQARLK